MQSYIANWVMIDAVCLSTHTYLQSTLWIFSSKGTSIVYITSSILPVSRSHANSPVSVLKQIVNQNFPQM